MTERVILSSTAVSSIPKRSFSLHGWIGLILIAIFWPLNWLLPGQRTEWAFFPLWLGYCLTIDAISLRWRGTSMFYRDWHKYVGLFLVSAPSWWVFEVLNYRIQNWRYIGGAQMGPLGHFLLASINFSIVIPAVFSTAELVSGFSFIQKMKPGWVIRSDQRTTWAIFAAGWVMLALLIAWPRIFFPFAWLSIFFLLEPVNVWLGNHSLYKWTERGDWRPIFSLFLGVLITGFFWEMWNYFSLPKWIYQVPGVNFLHVFEMPLLGYTGYLPFALEIYAMYHLVMGLLGHKEGGTVRLVEEME